MKPALSSISCAEFRQTIQASIVDFDEYSEFLSLLSKRMAFELWESDDVKQRTNNDPKAQYKALLKEILIEHHGLGPKEADEFAEILAKVPTDIDGAENPDDEEIAAAEERLFWRLVRWLSDYLRELVHGEDPCEPPPESENGDDPRDTTKPTVFGEIGEDSDWLLDHECIVLVARQLQEGSDEIVLGGNYDYLGSRGKLEPNSDFIAGNRIARIWRSTKLNMYTMASTTIA